MYETPRTFQTEDFKVPDYQLRHTPFSTLICPPDSLNSGKNPSQTDLPSGHRISVNDKPSVTLVYLEIRDNHLSTSAHRALGQRRLTRFKLYSIATDDNAGAESMEQRMFVRRGEGVYT